MCCNSCNPCSGGDAANFPVYLPLSQNDLVRLTELAGLYDVIQGIQNGSSGSNCGCNDNSCCGCG